jgi:cytochrome c oxidase subunit 4
MSTTTTEPVESAADHEGEAHAHDHPSDWKYVKVALILGVITAVEVATYFTELTTFITISLLAMMTAKFIIVAGYFMHLKYDNPLFKRVFVFGLFLALAVFLITLTTFEFWSDGFLKFLESNPAPDQSTG